MIQVKNLHFAYPDSKQEIISGINLQVKKGTRLAIMGKNGSGKSTLLKLLAGLLHPDGGRITVHGDNKPSDLPPPGWIAFAPESPEAYFFAPTVEEEIEFFPKNLGLNYKKAASKTLRELDIYHLAPRSPFSLSAGQQRKVSIASILSGHPQIVVLDEPTQGLHQDGEREVGRILNNLHQTVIFSTHRSDFAYQFAHRVGFLKEGKILSEEEVFSELCNDEMVHQAGVDLPRLVKWAKERSFSEIPRNMKQAVELAKTHRNWAT